MYRLRFFLVAALAAGLASGCGSTGSHGGIASAAAVRAAFVKQGIQLGPGLKYTPLRLRSPRAIYLAYARNAHIGVTGGKINVTPGGPRYVVIVFPSSAAARRALTPRLVALNRAVHNPSLRHDNVVLLAEMSMGSPPGWGAAVRALDYLAG